MKHSMNHPKTIQWSALSVLGLALLAPLSPAANAESAKCGDESRYPHVSLPELKKAIHAKATIVDVNSKASFAKVHVTHAVHFGTHQENFSNVLPQDKSALVIAYCGGPECTAWKKAAVRACELGYTNVRHFSGGLKEWMKANPASSS